MLSPARDGYATVLNYWEALTGVRGQAFSLTISRLLPKFFMKGIGKGNNYCAFLVIIRNNHYLCSDNYYNTENYAIIVNTRKCAVNITKC